MKRRLSLFVVLAVVLVAGAATWFALDTPQAEQRPATTAVARGDVEQTVLASGELEASKLVSVGAEVSGRIQQLHVKLGDAVKSGDLIAEIDSLTQENAVKGAQAALTNVTAQLAVQNANVDKARAALTRADELQKQKLISDADYQTAQAEAKAAEAQVTATGAQQQQAQLNVESAELNLSRTRITAPMDGTIVAVLVEEGQTVSANQSAPTIVKIANLDQMIVKAEISEADVPRVEPGQKVYFTILGEPDNKIDATLLSIEPAPESISDTSTSSSTSGTAVYYNGLFQVENPAHKLRIAMTAQVTIVLKAAEDALVIPSAALGRKGQDGSYGVGVYDEASGKTQMRRVSVGLNNNIVAEVTYGLNEGDLVVTGGLAGGAAAAARRSGSGTGNGFGGNRGGAGALFGGGPGGPPPGG